jgi:hypothetical protein
VSDEPKTYTQEEFDAIVAEREALAAEREAIKRNRDEVLTEKKTLAQKLADLETQDKASKTGVTAEQLEKLRADVRQALENEYAPFRTTAEQLAAENRSLKLDNVVKNVMAKSGVRADRIDEMFKLSAHNFDLTEDGKPIVKSNMGLEIGKYVKEDLFKSYPEWFEGSGSSGGGASKSAASGGGSRVVSRDDNQAFLNNIAGIAKGEVEVR